MKRLVPAVALALVVGATQPGCPFTAAGALIGLIAGSVSDDPYPDRNDRIRAHVERAVEIGFEIDLCLLAAILESDCVSHRADDDGRALAFVDPRDAYPAGAPKTMVMIGPASCAVAHRF